MPAPSCINTFARPSRASAAAYPVAYRRHPLERLLPVEFTDAYALQEELGRGAFSIVLRVVARSGVRSFDARCGSGIDIPTHEAVAEPRVSNPGVPLQAPTSTAQPPSFAAKIFLPPSVLAAVPPSRADEANGFRRENSPTQDSVTPPDVATALPLQTSSEMARPRWEAHIDRSSASLAHVAHPRPSTCLNHGACVGAAVADLEAEAAEVAFAQAPRATLEALNGMCTFEASVLERLGPCSESARARWASLVDVFTGEAKALCPVLVLTLERGVELFSLLRGALTPTPTMSRAATATTDGAANGAAESSEIRAATVATPPPVVDVSPALPEATVARISKLLFTVIRHLHDCGVVHRDVKLENLLYDEASDSLSLIDFGLASLAPAGVEGQINDFESELAAASATGQLLTSPLDAPVASPPAAGPSPAGRLRLMQHGGVSAGSPTPTGPPPLPVFLPSGFTHSGMSSPAPSFDCRPATAALNLQRGGALSGARGVLAPEETIGCSTAVGIPLAAGSPHYASPEALRAARNRSFFGGSAASTAPPSAVATPARAAPNPAMAAEARFSLDAGVAVEGPPQQFQPAARQLILEGVGESKETFGSQTAAPRVLRASHSPSPVRRGIPVTACSDVSPHPRSRLAAMAAAGSATFDAMPMQRCASTPPLLSPPRGAVSNDHVQSFGVQQHGLPIPGPTSSFQTQSPARHTHHIGALAALRTCTPTAANGSATNPPTPIHTPAIPAATTGLPTRFDPRAATAPPVDLWACGVIIYTLLEGGYPFHAARYAALHKQILSGAYLPPRRALSDGALDLIRRLLQVDPLHRAALEDALAHPWVTSHASVGTSGDSAFGSATSGVPPGQRATAASPVVVPDLSPSLAARDPVLVSVAKRTPATPSLVTATAAQAAKVSPNGVALVLAPSRRPAAPKAAPAAAVEVGRTPERAASRKSPPSAAAARDSSDDARATHGIVTAAADGLDSTQSSACAVIASTTACPSPVADHSGDVARRARCALGNS